ncbi:uncharacterized protein BCR38DRAFT_443519 [Pseudomassariella vexata]|uniref:Uncharacterized protein n=1 Tax=Pseudomassariella vexata TaxID=1141098 RepID=A0A1Y2DL70_9PEZI|nr:uncharacterized protein BCR38DRAFT_443519 [Pseudomassariella vexata]ORY59982.1 hypothetical protein BCR38DRAFT_443519 [Pseudomassariella vexata]
MLISSAMSLLHLTSASHSKKLDARWQAQWIQDKEGGESHTGVASCRRSQLVQGSQVT